MDTPSKNPTASPLESEATANIPVVSASVASTGSTAPSLGGTGAEDFAMGAQVGIQAMSVVITIVWSGVVSFIAYKLVDIFIGLRVPEDEEREGLDVTAHGETAYRL